jgi:single-stranded-DNA-specific exonuclease
MIGEAVAEIEENDWHERPAIVVGREGWNHGIAGIVAGRLASRYGRPVIAVGFDATGHGRGSVRGPKGARLHDALSAMADVLERFGGHQAAAGVEVRIERLPELRERFEGVCASLEVTSSPVSDRSVWLHEGDDPNAVLADVAKLEPCGQGNPSPRVLVAAELVQAREVRGGHLKLELELQGGRRMSGFGVNMGSRAASLNGRVVALGGLRRDTWRGGDAVELRVDELFGSGGDGLG